MSISQKKLVRIAIEDFLTTKDPEALDEFNTVFDSAYDILDSDDYINSELNDLRNDGAFSIDSSVIGQTLISLSCLVAYSLAKAALQDSINRDLPKILDKMEKKLSITFGKPELVKAIRERIEGILKNL